MKEPNCLGDSLSSSFTVSNQSGPVRTSARVVVMHVGAAVLGSHLSETERPAAEPPQPGAVTGTAVALRQA